jgi:hypothetical protein
MKQFLESHCSWQHFAYVSNIYADYGRQCGGRVRYVILLEEWCHALVFHGMDACLHVFGFYCLVHVRVFQRADTPFKESYHMTVKTAHKSGKLEAK